MSLKETLTKHLRSVTFLVQLRSQVFFSWKRKGSWVWTVCPPWLFPAGDQVLKSKTGSENLGLLPKAKKEKLLCWQFGVFAVDSPSGGCLWVVLPGLSNSHIDGCSMNLPTEDSAWPLWKLKLDTEYMASDESERAHSAEDLELVAL